MKHYNFTIDGQPYEVAIDSVEGRTAHVTVNGTDYEVELGEDVAPAPQAPVTGVSIQPAGPLTKTAPEAASSGETHSSAKKVTSPLPGVIIEVSVKEGQAVKAGEKVAVLEAMKMENEISADRDGTITAIHVAKGDSVLEGAPVVTIG